MAQYASRITLLLASRFTRHASPFWVDFAVACVIFSATMLLYGPSLTYPFVWHEADDLSRTLRYSPLDYVTGMPSYEYYRPLMFLLWRSILSVWGAASAPIFHGVSVGAHLLNSTLLFALVRDLTRNRTIAAAAALTFASYPFSYQAITWSTAHFHPAVLLSILTGLVVYVRARLRDKGWLAYSSAALCLVAAMLVHETGFVGALIVLLVEAYLVINRRVPRWSRWPLVYFAITLALVGLYAIAAKSPPAEKTLQWITGLYLLQGLVYPAVMLLARVCQPPACDSVAWLLPVSGLTLIAVWLAWRSGRTIALGLLGLIWFGLGVAPAWAGRDFTYNEYAPRLLYFAGAGTSLVLAALIGAQPQGWEGILRVGATALIVLQGMQFVIARQPLYAEALRVVDQENQAMFAPRQGLALFVNAVDLFAYKDREFPLGWFGVPVAPWHNRLGQVSHLRAENADWVIDPAQSKDVQAHSRLALEFHGRVLTPEQFPKSLASASQVYQIKAVGLDLHLFKIAEIEHGATLPASDIAEWAASIRLVAASIDTEAGVPVLNLGWVIDGPIDSGQTVFVHVRNATGEIVAQADGDLVGGLAALSSWAPGDFIRERRALSLPSNLPAGTYTVAVGLYDRASLKRTVPIRVKSATAQDGALVVAHFEHR